MLTPKIEETSEENRNNWKRFVIDDPQSKTLQALIETTPSTKRPRSGPIRITAAVFYGRRSARHARQSPQSAGCIRSPPRRCFSPDPLSGIVGTPACSSNSA
jgi:hypothetical protein